MGTEKLNELVNKVRYFIESLIDWFRNAYTLADEFNTYYLSDENN